MNKILLVLLLLVAANGVSAQYLYYKDHSKNIPIRKLCKKVQPLKSQKKKK